MSEISERMRRRSWSRYWASGALTSLPEDFRSNYDGEIRAFWQAQCAELEDGAAVLDVCTGNGAIALLVAEALAARGIDARITAVDLAEIRPDRIRQRFPQFAAHLDRIRFVGNRAFEQIALPDASQDLIVSQYGIEYCEPEAAARQCARLLRPGGRLAVITHAVDSDMMATMQAELDQFETLARIGVLKLFEDWRNGRLDTDALRDGLAEAGDRLRQQPGFSTSPLYGYALNLIDQVRRFNDSQLAAQRAAVLEAVEQLEDGRSRLDQMLSVNRRLHEPGRFAEAFRAAGLVSDEEGAMRYRGQHEVGRWAVFHKPRD